MGDFTVDNWQHCNIFLFIPLSILPKNKAQRLATLGFLLIFKYQKKMPTFCQSANTTTPQYKTEN